MKEENGTRVFFKSYFLFFFSNRRSNDYTSLSRITFFQIGGEGEGNIAHARFGEEGRGHERRTYQISSINFLYLIQISSLSYINQIIQGVGQGSANNFFSFLDDSNNFCFFCFFELEGLPKTFKS